MQAATSGTGIVLHAQRVGSLILDSAVLARQMAVCIAILAMTIAGLPFATAQAQSTVQDQHAIIGVASKQAQADTASAADLQWYRDAGLGMFIHWGISSVEGKHELSWAMLANIPWNANPITPEAYFRLADQFNPQNYDPEKWLKAAKDAGFGYAVLTTRHHDGYALWPSNYGEFSTRTHMAGRDLVRPYVEACRKVGLKVGFYYSPPDWYFNRHTMSFGYASKGTPESHHLGLRHEPVQLPKKSAEFEDQYVAYVNGQLTELMTRYGKINLLWFDGGAGPKVLSQAQLRAMQPGILINDRQHGKGDFNTQAEGDFPKARPSGLWEHCFSMVGAWGYRDSEPCGPAAELLVRLVKARAWGGNVLANFAPRPNGELPDAAYRCLADVQLWMVKHRESVVGVDAGPGPDRCNVPVTIRGKTWYLHLLPPDKGGIAPESEVALHGVGKPQKIAMLGTGKELPYQIQGESVSIPVPKELRTSLVDVIAVDW